jgi:hypothetical protein
MGMETLEPLVSGELDLEAPAPEAPAPETPKLESLAPVFAPQPLWLTLVHRNSDLTL